jgi:hypothetical protein
MCIFDFVFLCEDLAEEDKKAEALESFIHPSAIVHPNAVIGRVLLFIVSPFTSYSTPIFVPSLFFFLNLNCVRF